MLIVGRSVSAAVVLLAFIFFIHSLVFRFVDPVFRGKVPTSQATASIQPTTAYNELELAYQHWLPTFRASDPAYQDQCMRLLKEGSQMASYHEQDSFVFHNMFKYWPMQGRRGFYVDSGANDALVDSNTLFFD